MGRPVTLFTGQWADLPIEAMCQKAKEFGYDGLELCCWGDHIEVDKADQAYCNGRLELLKRYDLQLFTISTHLASQCVCDPIDERHKNILPTYIWGDGDPEGVRQRAAEEMIKTGQVAKRLGIDTVVGFTGSPIWHMLYSFPAVSQAQLDKGYEEFARRWTPILDEYQKMGVKYALEVHPTEIAFDIATAHRALKAVNYHPAFGFNYDPSHFGYQHVDYVRFINEFADRIFHVHMKDVYWSDIPTTAGVFGGHMEFGDNRRYWNFRSLGRGKINFENIIRALNDIGYNGPLSVEWEDSGMDREAGAAEACNFVKKVDFAPSGQAFDDVMKAE
ncbi:sugar phosphate isomerase/epimerase family protein [Gaoshiqia sediminis]|uniref:Sugar phosphate isomerase/epimerase n=1 Tax=Gaoshiqia sediminis TaxID=2986998 RepID=A0AA41Y410_9BACT|nr:sugar phosphate isomerase/epimerase [Gaoshiqia sediminis]MCW0481479.1 sugar phosphate isomerase/epimerase [Gaoshiqia sediminis]